MSNMNLKDALDRALRTTKQYIDEETKLDNVLDLERTVSIFEKGEIVLDENDCFNFENGELFYNLYNIESEIKINLNNTISDKEYLLNISDPEECTYRKSDNGTESFSFRIYDYEISKSIGISLTYVEFEGISQSTLTAKTIGFGEKVTITVNSFEIVTLEYKSKIQSKMIENVDYEKITNKPYPIISIENGTNKAIPFTDWIRFNKYNLIDRRTTDINNTPYENSTGKNNEVEHPLNEINPAGNGIRIYNTAASGMENAKGLKFNISQELVDNVNAGFITFSCTYNAVSRPTMVRLVSPNGLYSEDLIPFTQSHSGASTTGTFDLSFNTAEDYSYTLLAGDYYILFAVDDPEGDTSSLIDLSNVVVHIEPLQSEDKIKVTRDIDKFIERDNKIPYEPTGDYNPATKKYVDDAIQENGFSGDYNDLTNRPCYLANETELFRMSLADLKSNIETAIANKVNYFMINMDLFPVNMDSYYYLSFNGQELLPNYKNEYPELYFYINSSDDDTIHRINISFYGKNSWVDNDWATDETKTLVEVIFTKRRTNEDTVGYDDIKNEILNYYTDDIVLIEREKVTLSNHLLDKDLKIENSLSMLREGDIGVHSVSLGNGCMATGPESFAMGSGNIASGASSSALGVKTKATAWASHAEGNVTTAGGNLAHAEGYATTANGMSSHAEGSNTIASSMHQHVQGRFNIEDTENKYAHIVGNGTYFNDRKNAHTLDWNGNAWFQGNVSIDGTPANDKDLVTKEYVDNGMFIEVDDLELQILQSNEENLICDVWLTDKYSSTILKTNIDDVFILNDNIAEVKAQNYLYCDSGSKVRIESISLEDDNFVWETAFLRKIDFVEKFDLGATTSLADLYNVYGNPRITFPLFDTKNVTDMKSMFSDCSSLTSVPHYNTSKVTDMKSMFLNCSSLISVPHFDTSKVENMNAMFYKCSSLTSVPHFDTSKVTNMSWMLNGCSNLSSVPHFDTSKVTNMSYMLYGCSSLVSISYSDTSKVTDMNYMFYNCTSLENIYNLNISSCTKFSKLFDGCNKLKHVELISTDASKITSAVNTLPTHAGAAANAYIIDISKCSSDIISALSGLTRNGWTVKTIA